MDENYSTRVLGKLILEELKGIRQDVKSEVEKIGCKLQEILITFLHASNFDNDRGSYANSEGNCTTENVNLEENFPDLDKHFSVDQSSNLRTDDFTNEAKSKRNQADMVNALANRFQFTQNDLSASKYKSRCLYKSAAEEAFSDSEELSEPSSTLAIKEELQTCFRQKTPKQYFAQFNKLDDTKSKSVEQDYTSISHTNSDSDQESPENLAESSQLPQLFDTMMASINAPAARKSNGNWLSSNSAFKNQSLVKHTRQNDFYDDTLCTAISTSDGAKKSYCCNICGRSFAKRHYAKTHYKMHIGENTHECSICKVGFLTKSNLKRHMIVHTGKKPHECNICHRTFSFPSNMKRHMQNVHSKPSGFPTLEQ